MFARPRRAFPALNPSGSARMRKRMLILILLIPWLILLGTAYGSGAETEVLRVTGLVKQPLRLSLADLARLPLVRLKYNDITREGEFHGVFWFRWVPLRDILGLAQVGKEAGGFPKLTDLALVVRSRDGRQVPLLGRGVPSPAGRGGVGRGLEVGDAHQELQGLSQPGGVPALARAARAQGGVAQAGLDP